MVFTGQQSAILGVAREQLGKRYLYGAKGPDEFDCSGLTAYSFSHGAGIDIGAGTAGQLLKGTLVGANVVFPSIVPSLQPCDIVFPSATHCQLWTGNDIIEAASSAFPVREVPEWAVPPYQATVYQIRRYLPSSGPQTPPGGPRWPGRLLCLTYPYMTGQDVTEWQAQLYRLGAANLVVDGQFGPLSENATKAFQAAHGLVQDGVVGILSWTAAFG